MYYVKLLSIMGTMCLSSVAPILFLATLNEMIDPAACWGRDHSSAMLYLSAASVFLGMLIGDKLAEYFLR